MIVELIAYTQLVSSHAMTNAGWKWYSDFDPNEVDALAEFAGRMCYQSWSRPNPKTATNEGYLKHILEVGHESVLEHASATFYVAGVSRSLSHELVRHRHLSFSQLSQRFVNEEDFNFIEPAAVTRAQITNGPGGVPLAQLATDIANAYKRLVASLAASGLGRKQAREAARCVLPNATETRLVVTGNMRAWRDVLRRRLDAAADAEIQQLAREILRQLKEIAPNTFQDFNETGIQP